MLQGVGRFRPEPGRVILPDVCCGISCVGGRQFLTGPMTQAELSPHVGEDVLLLQMAPATARRLLGVPVAELTDRVVPLDEVNRALERLVYEHSGMPPKLFARIVRFRRAVVAARAGLPLAAASAAHGYADQAHFSREARSLTGRALRTLLPNVGNLQEVVSGEL